jgi:hypothetical protein
MDKVVQGLLGDGSGGHQAVAQAAAMFSLKFERLCHLFQGDQLGLDQQIAQSQSQSFVDGALLFELS